MEQVSMPKENAKWYEYVLLLFIILWSGGGFTYGLFPMWMLFMLPIVSFIFYHQKLRLSTSLISFIVAIIIIHLAQTIKFAGNPISIIRPICLLLSCALLSNILSNKFAKIYSEIIYYISWVCLVLWLVCLTPSGLSFLRGIASRLPLLGWDNIENNTNIVDSIYIFSIPRNFEGIMRNSGPFWEPGRFTIYIALALAINLFYYKDKITSKRNIILILANITTFSTTGYVAMAVLFIGYILYTKKSFIHKFLLSILLILVVYHIGQLDFMAEKIAIQSMDDSTWSRFGAMAYHWTQIEKSPIIGYGPFLSDVFGDELFSSPNGLTDLIRYYGIPLSLMMYYLLYKGTQVYVKEIHSGANICVFTALILLCFSQTITYSPFFMILYFFAFNTCHNGQ